MHVLLKTLVVDCDCQEARKSAPSCYLRALVTIRGRTGGRLSAQFLDALTEGAAGEGVRDAEAAQDGGGGEAVERGGGGGARGRGDVTPRQARPVDGDRRVDWQTQDEKLR